MQQIATLTSRQCPEEYCACDISLCSDVFLLLVTPEYLFAFCIDVVLENRAGTERLRVACEIETIEDGKAKCGTPQAARMGLPGIMQGRFTSTSSTFGLSIASTRFTGFIRVSSNVPWSCLRMKRSTLTEMKRDGTTAQRGRGEDDRRFLLVCLPSH